MFPETFDQLANQCLKSFVICDEFKVIGPAIDGNRKSKCLRVDLKNGRLFGSGLSFQTPARRLRSLGLGCKAKFLWAYFVKRVHANSLTTRGIMFTISLLGFRLLLLGSDSLTQIIKLGP